MRRSGIKTTRGIFIDSVSIPCIVPTSAEVRAAIEESWQRYLARYGNLYTSDSISGSSPPSVFVGSYGYPKVGVGPMLPPVHGDTAILDSPERWSQKSLEEIVNFRLGLVRGVQKVPVDLTEGRYIEGLQEMAMAGRPADSDIEFVRPTKPVTEIDGYSAPFGPAGQIRHARFENAGVQKSIEKTYYDRDMTAQDAVLKLYNAGIEISQIQKCFSIGMLGVSRRLVPTRWSITATDDIISSGIVADILDCETVDSCSVRAFEHLGNLYCVVLFPHRWMYELVEAWHTHNSVGFGADIEDARGLGHSPETAGAYYAARLAVAEYLKKIRRQAGVMVLREIYPEYAVPVGVWQVREGVRAAMMQKPQDAPTLESALDSAFAKSSISRSEWLGRCSTLKMVRQKTISDYT